MYCRVEQNDRNAEMADSQALRVETPTLDLGLFTHFDVVKYAPYWETVNHFVRDKKLFG